MGALAMALLLPATVNAETFTSPPSHIFIPSIDISLPVHTAQIVFDTWEVHLDGASFGDGTTIPGNIGNTAIFSHARAGLFGDLPKVKKGDMIHVFTDTDWFVYQVEDISVVSPDRVDVLDNHNAFELTLYTCIGENYTQRLIVKAKLLSNPSAL